MAGTYPNEVFSTFTFLGLVLSLIPLRWHLMAWNTGTVMFMSWAAIGCLNMFINSIVWKHTAVNVAPVWCDISTHLQIAVSVALPASSLCINRRLYHIANPSSAHSAIDDRRRALIIDLSIGVGIPFLQMIAYTIPQGHRFDIYEDIGCVPTTYNTPMAIVMIYIWPIILGLISSGYCMLTLHSFWKRRQAFRQLMSTNPNLTINRYFRLMGLAGADVLITLPLACWMLSLNLTVNPLMPWKGWADTHTNFGNVNLYPSVLWHIDSRSAAGLELNRWNPVIAAFIFFGWFGFAEEARKNYRSLASTISKHSGINKFVATHSKAAGTTTTSGSTAPTLPGLSIGSTGSLPTFINTNSTTHLHKQKHFDDKESFSPTHSLSSRFSYDEDARPLPPTPPSPSQQDNLSMPQDGANRV